MDIKFLKVAIWLSLMVLILSFLASCKDKNGCPAGSNCQYSIKINNASNSAILTYYQLNFPDTIIQENTPNFSKATENTYCYIDSDVKWEDVIKKNVNNTITIFVLDFDTTQKYQWSAIRNEYKILKRFELSSDSLGKLGWTLTYQK